MPHAELGQAIVLVATLHTDATGDTSGLISALKHQLPRCMAPLRWNGARPCHGPALEGSTGLCCKVKQPRGSRSRFRRYQATTDAGTTRQATDRWRRQLLPARGNNPLKHLPSRRNCRARAVSAAFASPQDRLNEPAPSAPVVQISKSECAAGRLLTECQVRTCSSATASPRLSLP